MNKCKTCKNWYRLFGKLASEWNLCGMLSQGNPKNCFIIPRTVEHKDALIYRVCTTYKDFGCVYHEKVTSK